MFGTFGFSYTGLIFLCCLFIPNILYGLNLPKDLVKTRESRILVIFERIGQALCTVLVLVFEDFNFRGFDSRFIWLVAATALMLIYLLCWGRYFLGEHLQRDFYRPFLGIPLPLAVLPVAAALLLSIYGKVIWLGMAAIVLGTGHIGITAQNWAAFKGNR